MSLRFFPCKIGKCHPELIVGSCFFIAPQNRNEEYAVMKSVIGTCFLGHCAPRDYVLLQFAAGVMVEPIIEISRKEMALDCATKVLGYLQDPPPPSSKPFSFSDPETKQKLLKLKRDYALIAISLLHEWGDELKITPLHFGRGWSFEISGDEVRRIELPIDNERFLELLRDAFDVAT
jgi:hypothetical protein